MRLATMRTDTPDGRLVVVSRDATRAAPVAGWPTLQAALEDWDAAEPALRAVADTVAAGAGDPLDPAALAAPLPRAWQWLDGSVYPSHGALMDKVLGITKPPVDWPAFEGVKKLGLTAGASAPEVLVEEIIDAFAARYDVTVDTVSTVVEDMVFPLPRELRSEAAAAE